MNISTCLHLTSILPQWQVVRLSLLVSCLPASPSVQQGALTSCALDKMRFLLVSSPIVVTCCYYTALRRVLFYGSNMFQICWDNFKCFSLFGRFTTPGHQGVHCSSAKVWKLRQQNSGDTQKEWTCWWLPSNSGSSTLKEFQNINPGLIIPSLLIGGLQIYERTLSITILSKSGLGHKKRQVSVTRDFRATIYRCKWLWMSQKTPTLPWSWELWNICTVGKDPTRY